MPLNLVICWETLVPYILIMFLFIYSDKDKDIIMSNQQETHLGGYLNFDQSYDSSETLRETLFLIIIRYNF
jgi:hypothetical protein